MSGQTWSQRVGPGSWAPGGAARPRASVALTVLAVGLAGLLGMLAVAAVLTRGLDSAGAPLALGVVGGVGVVGMLVLATVGYETAVGLGFLLLGVVRFEPAPPDAVFAVVIGVALVTGRFRLVRVPAVATAIVALLLVVTLLSMLDAVDPGAGVRYLFITSYLAIFSLWLAGFVDSHRRARLIVVAWLAMATISAVISSVALFAPVPFRSVILATYETDRAGGFFKDPNVFGPFVVVPLLIVIEQRLVLRARPVLRLGSMTSLLVALALTLGVLFSYSRAAWANALLGVGVLLVAASAGRSGAKRAIKTLILLVAVSAIGAAILAASGSLAFLQERAKVQSYDTERFAAQHLGWELGWAHPTGIGPGQFPSYSLVETHSSYVRVFAEQGPLGLLLWTALLLATLVLALQNVIAGRDTFGIGPAVLLAAWLGLVLNSFVVDTLHWRHLWAVAGLIWAGWMRRASPPGALSVRERPG